jgi:hypothetical protein
MRARRPMKEGLRSRNFKFWENVKLVVVVVVVVVVAAAVLSKRHISRSLNELASS